MCSLMGTSLAVFWNSVLKCKKNSIVLKKKGFECNILWSTRLLKVDFPHILKILHFSKFFDILKFISSSS